MADADDAWSANSNDAVVVSLVTPGGAGLSPVTSFNPQFTYPIFGEEERIFGYKNLKIGLRYHAADMRPNVKITHDKVFKAIGDVEPTDVKEALKPFLPEVAFAKESEYVAAIEAVPSDWSPPGSLLTAFAGRDGQYEIWQGSLADPAVKQLLKRIQVLVSFFIEGGTPIDTEGEALDRWTVFFLYKKAAPTAAAGRSPYVFTGYSTVYRFFPFRPLTPPASPSKQTPADAEFELPEEEVPFTDFPCRTRISQFVVLPPFQGTGNGARLYNAILDHYLKNPQTFEITVEDPNEAFDELRDLSDLAHLRTDPEFASLRINAKVVPRGKGPVPRDIVDEKALEKLRARHKIAPRQFHRVVEMHLLSTLADAVRPNLDAESPPPAGAGGKGKAPAPAAATPEQEHEYRLWRLQVKQRLYRHNKDLLGQLEHGERIDRLEDALQSVELEYARLLAAFEGRQEKAAAANGKRKADENGEEPPAKRPRAAGDA